MLRPLLLAVLVEASARAQTTVDTQPLVVLTARDIRGSCSAEVGLPKRILAPDRASPADFAPPPLSHPE